MMRTVATRVLVFAVLWWLAVEGAGTAWGLGLLAVGAATATSFYLWPQGRSLSLTALPAFLAFFLWQSFKGSLQVARLALRPRLALDPALIEIKLSLPEGAPRTAFTAVLGLMPGSLGIHLTGDRLLVHVLDARLLVTRDAAALQAHIARLFQAWPGAMP